LITVKFAYLFEMSRLSEQLQLALDQLDLTARSLEARADLPHMTVSGISSGRHPRTERFEKLLAAIPSLEHRCKLLIAYVLDDAPESHCPAIEQILSEHLLAWHQAHGTEDGVVQELPTRSYRPRSDASLARTVLDTMRHAIDSGDSELAHWLATTGQLLTAPHLTLPQDDEG
jgi:nitric oxide reductase activation protein